VGISTPNKTLEIIKEQFSWPESSINVHEVLFKHVIWHRVKRHYSPLLNLNSHWEDVRMDFILILSRTLRAQLYNGSG